MESYEKKYKEAFKWIESLYPKFSHEQQMEAEAFFPELKESEDERIRKAIIRYLKRRLEISSSIPAAIGSWIAWLEKQGDQKTIDSLTPQEAMDIAVAKCFNEQKSADKIEPKFKVGEWITHNTANFVFKIINVGSNGYEVVNRENYKKTISFDNEDNYHLWTIQDAKDGDVLKYKDCTFIFKKTEPSDIVTNIKNPLTILGYCGINRIGFEKSNGWGDTANCKYYPATKEQRDLLFQKMHEAGYMWDSESKQLLFLKAEPSGEQKPATIDIDKMVDDYANNKERGNEEFGKPVPCMIRAYRQGLNDAIGKVMLKPAWSEEDDMMIEETLYFLREYQQSNRCKDESGMQNSVTCEKWLKSLKERINEKQ